MLWNWLCRTIRISDFLKELPAPKKGFSFKKVAIRNKNPFEKVHALNNYLFWRKCSSETVAVLKKYWSSRSSWLENVLLSKSRCSKQLGILKKNLSAKISHFHYNQCCSGNIAASIISLFHDDWCSEIRWKKVHWQNWTAANFNPRKMHSTV